MWNIVINLAIAVAVALLTPPPPEPEASELSDFDIPVTKEGQEVGQAFGSPWIKAASIAWYGDFKKESIKSSGSKK